MIRALLVLYLASFVFEGVIRWVLGSVGGGALLYVRDFALVQAAYLWFVLQPKSGLRDKRPFLVIVQVLVLHSIVGFFILDSIFQVLFGFKAFVSMLVGTLAYNDFAKDPNRYVTPIAVLFVIAAIGVLGQSFVDYPWTGFKYGLGDMEFGNREWGMLGISRIAGFGRVSFETAAELLFFSLMLMCFVKRRLLAIAVWMLAAVSIALTTTKGIAGAFVACSGILLVRPILPVPPRWYARTLIPIASITAFVPFVGDASVIDIRDPTYATYLGSLWVRLAFSWPDALWLIREHGNVFLGRGVGGIGASQMFERGSSAADNLGLHLYATFGLLGFVYLALIVFMAQRLDISARPLDKFVLLALLSAIIFGITASVVESSTINIWIGIAIAHLMALSNGRTAEYRGVIARAGQMAYSTVQKRISEINTHISSGRPRIP
jgi:hypothetical protein